MIRAWQTQLLLATGLLGLAHLTATPSSDDARAALRDVVRPFLLPSLWARLDAASRAGDPGEMLAAGRAVSGLMPGWTDGTVHFAWICAFELAREHPGRDALADLLLAVDWLREAAEERAAAGDAEAAAELWMAAATFVDHAAADQDLAARIRTDLEVDPSVMSRDLVACAAATAPGDATESRLAFATVRLIAGAVRMDDLDRASATIDVAKTALRPFAQREDAGAALAALDRLRPMRDYREDPAALDELAKDPMLSELAEALRAMRR